MAGVSAGTAYVDLLPNMTKFGPATAAGVKSSTASLGSKLKGTFGTLGVALGVTFAIGFAKNAFGAFEDAQKSVAGFNAALENTHQLGVINQDTFNDFLSDFALGIGKDDDAIRDLATKLVNAFDFSKFGGDAQAKLEQVTVSIQDMSAATGLAETRLTKMFLAILNDPGAATVQLQKLGVVTEAEADHLTAMAEAGEDAAVTTILLDKVSEKYQGTAADTATSTEKMSAAWGEFQETVGGLLSTVLAPLTKLFTFLFRQLADKPVVVYALATAFTALGIAMARAKFAALFTSMAGGFKSLAGIPRMIAGVASGIGTKLVPALTGGAAAAAGFGVALLAIAVAAEAIYLGKVIADIQEFNNQAEDAESRARALQFGLEVIAGKTLPELTSEFEDLNEGLSMEEQVKTLASTVGALSDRFVEGRIDAAGLERGLRAIGLTEAQVQATLKAATAAFDEQAAAAAAAGDEVGRTGRKYVRFAQMTKKEFGEWATAIVDNFTTAAGGLTSFTRVFTLTARALERNADNVREALAQEKQDLDALIALGLDDEVTQRLMVEGPAAIRAFMESSDEGRRNVVADILDIIKNEKELENRIRGVDAGAMLFARHAREDLGPATRTAGQDMAYLADQALRAELVLRRMSQLDPITAPTVGGNNNTPSEVPPGVQLAAGGLVRRPMHALISEAGPEVVIPLDRLERRGPTTLRILDWRNGIALLGDEQDWDDGGHG